MEYNNWNFAANTLKWFKFCVKNYDSLYVLFTINLMLLTFVTYANTNFYIYIYMRLHRDYISFITISALLHFVS